MATVKEIIIEIRADTAQFVREMERIDYQHRMKVADIPSARDWRSQYIGLGVTRVPRDRDR